MSFISIFLMSFALAMDAFAVSVTKGITLRKINFSTASKIALFFGIFQGIMPSIFLMSFALAMDAFAVSVTKGITLRKINFSTASKIALFFGIFQGIMPLIGWFIGIRFESYIKTVDHWIALLLLGFIGLKMILEAKNDNSLDNISSDKLEIKELIVLSIATSIDALAVGVSFAFLNEPIFSIISTIAIVTFISDKLEIKELIVLSIATSIDALAVGVSFAFLNEPIFSIISTIAIVTFILCFWGVLLGKSIGSLFKNYAQIIGGIILILIGFNILNSHTGIIATFF